jgi:hypothetical protein
MSHEFYVIIEKDEVTVHSLEAQRPEKLIEVN